MTDMINIQTIKKQLEEKSRKRDKFLGQKEMLLTSLKDQGFESPKKAEIEVIKINKQIDKMRTKYQEGVELFVKKYKDLLND